jgi:feruloyl esterase
MPVGGELSVLGWGLWFTGGLNHPVDTSAFHAGTRSESEYPAPVAPNAHFAFGNGVMKYLVYHDPDWNYADYSFENFRADAAVVAPTLNATSPDISKFRDRGGKLLMWSGWADMALSPLGTIEYYEQVLEHDAAAINDVRLIMMPGVDHCAGGAGPFVVDYLDAIDTWVETGTAPDQMTAYWLNEKNQPEGSRPVCAYPKHLVYKGPGDTRDASNFSCKE